MDALASPALTIVGSRHRNWNLVKRLLPLLVCAEHNLSVQGNWGDVSSSAGQVDLRLRHGFVRNHTIRSNLLIWLRGFLTSQGLR